MSEQLLNKYLFNNLNKYDLRNNLQDQLTVFGYSFIFWVAYFFIINKTVEVKGVSQKSLNDIKNRIVSATHGLSIVFLSSYHITFHNQQLDSSNSDFQQFVFIFSIAYFLYDSIACLYYGIDGIGIAIHHAMVVVAYLSSMTALYGGVECMYALFFAELSNFPMNARQCVRSMNLRYTNLHEFFEYTFIILYIIARGIFVPFAVAHCVRSPVCPTLLKIICLGLFAQSIYYIFEMLKGIKRRGKQQKERKQKNIQYFWFQENPEVQQLTYYRKFD
ncbi:hypothetical protein ABPG72_014903 [Tetrahymena utriculariae]